MYQKKKGLRTKRINAAWEEEIVRLGELERTPEAYAAFSTRWVEENGGQEALMEDVRASLERERNEEMEISLERERNEEMEIERELQEEER
jgi:hypothetical protein